MNWYNVDEVLAKADLPDVARRLGMEVERRGASLVTLCPFHEDNKPSLVLYPRDGGGPPHFHCFSCNAHGYAVDLVKQIEGIEFRPAIEWLARGFGIAPQRAPVRQGTSHVKIAEDALSFALRVFDQAHDEDGFADWCRQRGFVRDYLFAQGLRCLRPGSALIAALREEAFGRQRELIDGLLLAGLLVRLRHKPTATAQASLDLSEQFRDYFHDGRVLIPIRTLTKDVTAFAGRYRPSAASSDGEEEDVAKYLLTPGFRKSEVLFNAGVARDALAAAQASDDSRVFLYVVEGFLDAFRLTSLGFPAVALMGTSLSSKQREILTSLLSDIGLGASKQASLRLFLDRDTAGFEGTSRAARQLLGLAGIETEWIAFSAGDAASAGKDPDEVLKGLTFDNAKSLLDVHAVPAIGVLVASGLGYKDGTPLLDGDRWSQISRYPRERALVQAARAVRALSGAAVDWAERLREFAEPRPQWLTDLSWILGARSTEARSDEQPAAFELTFLVEEEARLNHARALAEHGSRRGELPCDDETWRALDRNAQIFNILALDRLKRPAWRQAALYDAVHLPRKLSSDESVLNDPRRKVMPHAADLHLQQFLMNELLTERHDFTSEGIHTFSDCIPAVRWYGIEREVRLTGYVRNGEANPALPFDDRGDRDEPVLSFAYQVDMDVLEGRRKPTDQGMFRPYIDCWRAYMAALDRQTRVIGPHVHALRLDAKRYYDEIQRFVVRDRLLEPIEHALTITGAERMAGFIGAESDAPNEVAIRIVDSLCSALFEHQYRHPDTGVERSSAEVKGIPQGPVISAWIGTIALFPVDGAARAFMRQPEQRHPDDPARARVGYARYVDDIVLLADSESRLSALREAVQSAASHLGLTLVRKGTSIVPGSPESVMRQLNHGRALAPSVPVWEPPMVGDAETGWGMTWDDSGAIDRQSALHLLRHPSLLDDVAAVHEKVREAMRAPDLRPSDLGKCARALWWQVAVQGIENERPPQETETWPDLWRAYCLRWDDVCVGHGWASAFQRLGYDTLFAVEGLDMLLDAGHSMEKGRPHEWIGRHQRALQSLTRALLTPESILEGIKLKSNGAHIRRRARIVQWKALQRHPSQSIGPAVEPQQTTQLTLTDWLCQAAILLHRFQETGSSASHPLVALQSKVDPTASDGPSEIQAVAEYLKPSSQGGEDSDRRARAEGLALPFLVANTTKKSRWHVLSLYPDSLAKGLPQGAPLQVLPPLPVDDAGMLAYRRADDAPGLRLLAFQREQDVAPPECAPGAACWNGESESVSPVPLQWLEPEMLAHGLYRYLSRQVVGLTFDLPLPNNRARFAADLYEALNDIQRQQAPEGKEWVVVVAHLAHEPIDADSLDLSRCKWHLVSTPLPSSHLGVSAWVRDGRGGLRSVTVPGGEYTRLWRLGCAVTDAVQMAVDLPDEPTAGEGDTDELAHPSQIEDYVLRQQLSKLRGTWLSDAQLQDALDSGLPKTVRRALDILRQFDASVPPARQVRLVMVTEAETRSMAMRLQGNGPSDLRDRLHLLPGLVLQRLPLSVLECLPLHRTQGSSLLRCDLAFLLSVRDCAIGENEGALATSTKNEVPHFGSAEALDIGLALAAAGTALRGLAASVWAIARHRNPIAIPVRLPIRARWSLPDEARQDPQRDYDTIRAALIEDDWPGLRTVTPWQWMLALIGMLDRLAPQLLEPTADGNALRDVYEALRQWQCALSESGEQRRWTWPYDDMPEYDKSAWNSLVTRLPHAVSQVEGHFELDVKQVEAPVFRRHRDSSEFTDADSEQWTLAKAQYTSVGSADSVARTQRGSRRLVTWSEVRRRADGELLSVHTLDDKLGRWWDFQTSPATLNVNRDVVLKNGSSAIPTHAASATSPAPVAETNKVDVVKGLEVQLHDSSEGAAVDKDAEHTAPDGLSSELSLRKSEEDALASFRAEKTRSQLRESRLASWTDRAMKCPSHMRVALLQWQMDECYSHPLSEAGLIGMGMPEMARNVMEGMLNLDSSLKRAHAAASRGNEHTWIGPGSESIESWPEHRRRSLIKRALEACHQLNVDLLVLPEVSVRRETVDWLDGELRRHHVGLGVLAGTYRHFEASADRHGDSADEPSHLMAPLTLLWSPAPPLAEALFGEGRATRTLRFWRGKKYRAVAANELFHPHWDALKPLFRIDPLLEQLGDMPTSSARQKAMLRAIGEQLPPLRYCMELICSELFLLTSPANVEPLRQEVSALLKRFPSARASGAVELVEEDLKAVGAALSVVQYHATPRRTVLLVPAATKRSNDYWHAGQASVLASGTATVFCNAAESAIACGGSCFIGIDSATKPHAESPGVIETLTPYHGWRKGILTARTDGALSNADQALVIADIDPVHVVTGKPRPQLLPEPMALVAYLPIVELLDSQANRVALEGGFSKGPAPHLKADHNSELLGTALATVAASTRHKRPVAPAKFWNALHDLLVAGETDGPKMDAFAALFCDPKAVHSRLQTWARDRDQQPHPSYGPLNREPAWLDFLEVDLTLKEGQDLPRISVPPWRMTPGD